MSRSSLKTFTNLVLPFQLLINVLRYSVPTSTADYRLMFFMLLTEKQCWTFRCQHEQMQISSSHHLCKLTTKTTSVLGHAFFSLH